MKNILQISFFLVILSLTACSPTEPNTNTGLDSKGGTVQSSDGKASLVVEAQTLTIPTLLTLMPSNQTTAPGNNKVLVSGSVYMLASSPATVLSKPATLSLKYDPSVVQGLSSKLGVKAQAAANTLEVARFVDNTWQVLSGITINEAANSVQVPVTEMGIYGLLAPDGSKPVWQLEVRGGVGAVDSSIASVGILSQSINRNYLYIGLTRNGEAPTAPVALHVDGPNGYAADLSFAAGNLWSVYSLATRQAGTFTVKLSEDGQEQTIPVDIALTPTLSLPVVTSQVTGSTVGVGWKTVTGAQSYEVRLYSSGLSVLQTIRTKNINTTLTVPTANIGTNLSVMVLAYSWDATLEASQAYSARPEVFNAAASVHVPGAGTTDNPKISAANPQSLSLSALLNKSATGTITISSVGTQPLTYSAKTTGSGFQIGGTSSGTLYPGNATQLTITGACSTSATTLTGSLDITSNDPIQPSISVPLKLACLRPLTSNLVFSRVSHSANPILTSWSPDGSSLASMTANDGRVIVWNTTTGDIRQVFTATRPLNYGGGGYFLAWSPDSQYLAATIQASSAQVWSIATGKNIISLEGLSNFTSLAWRPDGTQIAALNSNTSDVAIFNVSTGSIAKQFNAKSADYSQPTDVAWTSNTRLITSKRLPSTYIYPNEVSVWSLDTNPVGKVATYTYNSTSPLNQSGTQIVGIVLDNTTSKLYLELRQAQTGTLIRRMGPLTLTSGAMARDILFSGDGTRVGVLIDTSGGASPTPYQLEVWNATNGTQISAPSVIASGEIAGGTISWNTNGSQFAFPTRSAYIRLNSSSTNQTNLLLGYNTGWVRGLQINANNQLLSYSNYAYSYSYGNVATSSLAWSNLTTHQTLRMVLFDNSVLTNGTWRSNGNLTVLSENNTLRTINGQTGDQISSVTLQDAASSSSSNSPSVFSPDGGKLLWYVSQAAQNVPYIFNSDTGAKIIPLQNTSLPNSSSGFSAFTWSSDATRIWGAGEGIVGTWDPVTGERTSTTKLEASCFGSSVFYSFSADGSKMLCSSDFDIRVFDTATGKALNSSSIGSGLAAYKNVLLAPNGLYYATQKDGQILVVSFDGTVLASMPRYTQGFISSNITITWSKDSNRLMVGESDGTLQVWQISQ